MKRRTLKKLLAMFLILAFSLPIFGLAEDGLIDERSLLDEDLLSDDSLELALPAENLPDNDLTLPDLDGELLSIQDITPVELQLVVNETCVLKPDGLADSDQGAVEACYAFSSSKPEIADVSPAGVVTGWSVGTAETAASGTIISFRDTISL